MVIAPASQPGTVETAVHAVVVEATTQAFVLVDVVQILVITIASHPPVIASRNTYGFIILCTLRSTGVLIGCRQWQQQR